MPESNAEELPPVTFTEAGVCHFCSWRNVTVGVWVARATLGAVRGLYSVGGQMSRRFPLHSSFTFIRDQVPAPAAEFEELLARTFGLGSDLACMAVVLEGTGFWASALRRLITNMHRAGRGNVQLQIATKLDDLLSWFADEHARRTGVQVELQLLRDTLQRMRDDGVERALRPARS